MRLHEIESIPVELPQSDVDKRNQPIPGMGADESTYNVGWLKLKKAITTHCSDIVNVYEQAHGFLMRGMHTSRLQFVAEINKYRRPTYMNEDLWRLSNKVAIDMGFAAHRGNSIFCHADPFMASAWGSNLFAIFPFNGFKFTWFEFLPKNKYAFDYLIRAEEKAERSTIDYDKLAEVKYDYITAVYKKLGIMDTNLVQAIQQKTEVLITGTDYIAVNLGVNTPYKARLMKWFGMVSTRYF